MEKKCIVCGNTYTGRNKYTCCMKCWAEYKQNYKTCAVCGKSFPDSQSNLTKCCSPECRTELLESLHDSGRYDEAIEKWLDAKEEFNRTHTGEKHQSAKYWVLQSPTGEIYRFLNLQHFVRENIDLFEGRPELIIDNIRKIKSSKLGKRKRPFYTYKGWQLLDWSD